MFHVPQVSWFLKWLCWSFLFSPSAGTTGNYIWFQKFLRVAAHNKTEALLEALEKDVSKGNKVWYKMSSSESKLQIELFQVVIFSNKSSTAYFVQMFLKENNIDCVGFSQREHFIERRKNLDKFLTGEVEYKLLKTSQWALTHKIAGQNYLCNRLDVAWPGHSWCEHIEKYAGCGNSTNPLKVTHVINYDFPLNPSDYIHRAGRVGRVGGAKVNYVHQTLMVGFRVKRKGGIPAWTLSLDSLLNHLFFPGEQGNQSGW